MVIIISLLVFIIDLISKVIVSNNLELYESIGVIENFFNITYTHNYGGAWSIFENSTLLITIISIIIITDIIVSVSIIIHIIINCLLTTCPVFVITIHYIAVDTFWTKKTLNIFFPFIDLVSFRFNLLL